MPAGRDVPLSDDSGAVPWDTVEKGVHAWIAAGAELASNHVQFQRQTTSGDPAPVFLPDRFAAIRFTSVRGLGDDWESTVRTVPDDPTTIVHHVSGPRVATLQVRVYNCDPFGKHTMLATLDRILAVVRLPSIRKIIRLGHFGVGHVVTPPRTIDLFREKTLLDPYGMMEVDINLGSDVSEPGHIISFVRVGVKTPSGVVLVPPTWIPKDPP